MNYYLLGASNPETIRVINAIKKEESSFNVVGFLDNDNEKHGINFYGYPVIGGVNKIDGIIQSQKNTRFVNLITRDTITRFNTTKEITDRGGSLGNLIHPTVDLSMVEIGFGNYFQQNIVVQAGVKIGNNCSIHMGALVGHETVIGDHCFIAHAVSISGCCEIGDGCFIGTNATIFPRVKIGKWVTIGAGTVINKNVPDFSVIVGNPGRVVKTLDPSLIFDTL